MREVVDRLNKLELAYTESERSKYHFNCAEILLMAANEKYKLELDDRFIKAVCPFGGGMQLEKTCGSLTGAIVALGIMYTKDKPSTNEEMKEITKKFVAEFEKEFGSLDCSYLKAHYRSETEGCNPIKFKTAEIFERVVNSDS